MMTLKVFEVGLEDLMLSQSVIHTSAPLQRRPALALLTCSCCFYELLLLPPSPQVNSTMENITPFSLDSPTVASETSVT
jgi:hypothetical protein